MKRYKVLSQLEFGNDVMIIGVWSPGRDGDDDDVDDYDDGNDGDDVYSPGRELI